MWIARKKGMTDYGKMDDIVSGGFFVWHNDGFALCGKYQPGRIR